ncbi:MAG: DUF4160 domain-containing protein [Chromatiaceae bacterium]|nr:DUF4160 domain-containing protein [Chromatiaceae bacterium]MBP6806686.1 DUF4160 domain-containing protein [Chromatiaceae bacterium]MBP8288216.1 DUF4160 domain-containing protein [Chromatiaceae bacterium]
MPVISMFYGIIVMLYFFDDEQHNRPHIHVRYQGQEASLAIDDGACLAGSFPPAKLRLVQAWIEIHRDELLADWELAVNGEAPFRVDPLK